MGRMRLLDLMRPLSVVLPEVEMPYSKIDPQERLIYTVVAAFLFVIMTEVPLHGTHNAMQSADPVAWLRPALGMSHGSLVEFGALPIVLSGIIVQSLAGLKKINVNLDLRSDRALFQSLQKFAALLISAVFALLSAYTPGYFGGSSQGGLVVAAQLFVGSGLLVYIDEFLSKGYGFVTGTLLFTLVTSSQYYVWSALGLESVTVHGKDTPVTYGVFPSLFFGFNNRSTIHALTDVSFRTGGLPTLFDVIFNTATFCGILYLSMLRLNMQIRSTKMRAQSSSFPVRILYTGVQPLLFVAASLAAVLLASYSLSKIYGGQNLVVRVFGVWSSETGLPQSGLAALLVPTYSGNILIILLRAVVYVALFAGVGAWTASVWTQSSGFAPQDIAKTFKENAIVLVGKRDVSVVKELRRVIPFAATVGGALLGLIVAASDVIGPAGSGVIMSVAALNVFAVFELLAQEGMGPDVLQGLM